MIEGATECDRSCTPNPDPDPDPDPDPGPNPGPHPGPHPHPELPQVKAAGFQGLCFDIEMTKGEMELVREVEKVFALCKAHGLLVMVTTSHSAPYA